MLKFGWGWNLARRRGPEFHPHRCSVSPVRGEKPQNRPLSKLYTGRFALRAMLPVINLRTVKWAQWDKTQSRELLVLFICVCIALCTIVAHNIAQNRHDNFPSYAPDNHQTTPLFYQRRRAEKKHTISRDQRTSEAYHTAQSHSGSRRLNGRTHLNSNIVGNRRIQLIPNLNGTWTCKMPESEINRQVTFSGLQWETYTHMVILETSSCT